MSDASMAVAQHRRGALRAVRPWRRFDVAELRLSRLASDLEAEADRHVEGTNVHGLIVQAGAAVRQAAAKIADPEA